MVTRDVLKVLKLHSPTARAILRTFKTSLVLINPEMHSRSYDFLYIYHGRYEMHHTMIQFLIMADIPLPPIKNLALYYPMIQFLMIVLTLGLWSSFRLSVTISQCFPFELYDSAYLVTQLSNIDWPCVEIPVEIEGIEIY